MSTVFTDHIRALDADQEFDGSIRDAFRAALQAELRKRGILGLSPQLLGYVGSNWTGDDPMDDLVHDCYLFAIVQRLRGLKNQLKMRDSIDGYVRLNIRNFVGERQRQADPVGYSIFQNLKAALIELGQDSAVRICCAGDDERIDSSTVVRRSNCDGSLATDDELRNAITSSHVNFEGITRLVRVEQNLQQTLAKVISQIVSEAVPAFEVSSIVRVLRQIIEDSGFSVSTNASNISDTGAAKFWSQIRTVSPDSSYEDLENVGNTVQQLNQAIDTLPRSLAVRNRLKQILQFLAQAVQEDDGVKKGTNAEIGDGLGIARSTLHDDMRVLRELADRIS